MKTRFLIILFIYALGTLASLIIALSPLSTYLYWIFQSRNGLYFLSLPLGVAFFWFIGFFIFVFIHAIIVVPIILPQIRPGQYSLKSYQARLYALRLGADNIAKYWVKSLEWIPYLTQLFLYAFMLRKYGVKIGKNVYLSTEIRIDGIPLISIGDNCFVAPRAVIGAHINLHGSELMFKEVKIGNNCVMGHLSVITPGCTLHEKSTLGAYSGILPHTTLPADTTWVGLPAKQVKES